MSSVTLSQNQKSNQPHPLLDKQIKEINKQKDFLLKLQRDKELLELQMRENEQVMNARMLRLQEEKTVMELRLHRAALTI
jgi:hypothetical protein